MLVTDLFHLYQGYLYVLVQEHKRYLVSWWSSSADFTS